MLLVFDDHDLVEWIDTHPCLTDDVLTLDRSYRGKTAVGTVVAIVTHNKVFIIAQCDGFRCQSRILDGLQSVIFFQKSAVDIDLSGIIDVDRLARKTDDTLDIIGVFFISIREDDDIKTLRIM